MKRSSNIRFIQLAGIGALGLGLLAWAPAAQAHPAHPRYRSYPPPSPYDHDGNGRLDPRERHEMQHDTNRNGRLEPWEHEALHRHEAHAHPAIRGPRSPRRVIRRHRRAMVPARPLPPAPWPGVWMGGSWVGGSGGVTWQWRW